MTRPRILAAFLAVLALCPGGSLSAKDIVMPEPEAPTTIFSAQIGGADVDLDLSGSWQAAVSGTLGLLFVPGSATPLQGLDALPPLNQGFLFTQTPDLTASLFLFKKLFLDVSVQADSTRNSLMLGYRGDSSELVRSVLLGNRGVSMEPSGFVEIPDQGTSSLGASALLVSGSASNQFLLRWDSSEEKVKTFLGPNELVEETAALDTFIRGRFFFLPDTGVQNLTVYIEDPQSTQPLFTGVDGKRYRVATLEDGSVDSANGLVSLKTVPKGRVLAYYTKGGLQVGNAGLGAAALPGQDASQSFRDLSQASLQFYWGMLPVATKPNVYLGENLGAASPRRITVAGNDCLMLWEPGDTSPFEIDSSYAFANTPPTDPSRIQIQFTARSAGASLPTGFNFRPLAAENRFSVVANTSFRADFHNMYPFDDPQGLIYGPPRDSLAGSLPIVITSRFLSPVQGFPLDPNLVPGSVRVTVNGIPETRFTVDISTGLLTFTTSVLPTDRVEIRYRASSTTVSGGDILFVWKDTLAFSDAFTLALTAGIRWNADPWSYTQKAYTKSGTILASAQASGKGEKWSYAVQAAAAYTNPDTSGILRLFGMEGNSLAVDLSEDNAFPASPPDPSEISGLSAANRGYLYYKNYRTYDALGNAALLPITSTAFSAVPYASGGKSGPYNLLGSSAGAATGSSLVFDFSLDAAGKWVGAQLPPVSSGDADLSTARSVTIRYKATGIIGSPTLYLQLGAISEDLSADGTVHAESSATDAGFPFVDSAHGVTLTLLVGGGPRGQGNGKLDTEDRNANGILDIEEPSRVKTLSVAAAITDTDWKTVTLSLLDPDRALLRQTRALRLVIVSVGSPSEGKILVDSLSVEGAAEFASASAGTYSVREVAEQLALSDPGSGNRLTDKFPKVTSMFHANGERQEVLEANWSGITPPLTVTAYTGSDTGGIQYDSVLFYLRIPGSQTSLIGFEMLDAGGKGIQWSIDPVWAAFSDRAWHEIKVSKTAGIAIDGAAVAGASSSFDAGYGSLSMLTITSSDTAGLIYLDEIQGQDPEGSVGAALKAEASYNEPGVILSLGGVPLLGNVSVHQSVSLMTPGFSTLYGIPSPSEDLSSRTELAADIAFTRLKMDLVLREYAGSFSASGSHRVTFPSTGFPLSATDAFSLTWLGEFTRENQIDFRPAGGLSLSVDTQSSGTLADPTRRGSGSGLLNQSWEGRAAVSPTPPLSLTADLLVFQSLGGYPLPRDWYGKAWIDQMPLVLPYTAGVDVERRGTLDMDLRLQPSPFGFQVEAKGFVRGSDFTSTGRTQQNDLTLALTALLTLGTAQPNTLSMSLGYTRLLSLLTAPTAGERFLSEGESYAELLSGQAYLLNAVPFTEIFQDNAAAVVPAWSGVSKGVYSPSVTLSLERGYSSRLIDLLLPTNVDVTVGQQLKKDADLTSTVLTISPKLSSQALNLFGQLGAYPLLPFVRTDQYGVSASATLSGAPGSALTWAEALVTVSAALDGASGERVNIVQSFKRQEALTVSLSDSTQVAFEWEVKPPGGLPVPLIPADIGATGYLAHRETAEADARFESSGGYHALTLVVGHATSIVFPAHGFLKASLQLAFDAENLLGGLFAYRIGVEGGIEAKLSF